MTLMQTNRSGNWSSWFT